MDSQEDDDYDFDYSKAKDKGIGIVDWNESTTEYCDEDRIEIEHFITTGICLPIIVAFGVAFNCLDIAVFSQKNKLKQPINMFLLALSVADMCSLISDLLLGSTRAWIRHEQSNNLMYFGQVLAIVFFPLTHIFQSISLWLTVALTVHKFIGIRFPFYARRNFTVRKTILTIGAISIAALLCDIWKYQYLRPCISDLSGNMEYRIETAFVDVYSGSTEAYLFLAKPLLFIITFFVMLGLNIAIAMAAKRKNSQAVRRTSQSEKENKTTLMLIVLVFVFLVCNGPVQCVNLTGVLNERCPYSRRRNVKTTCMTETGNCYRVIVAGCEDSREFYSAISFLVAEANCCFNTFIFYAFSREYRKSVNRLFAKTERNGSSGSSQPKTLHNTIVTRLSKEVQNAGEIEECPVTRL